MTYGYGGKKNVLFFNLTLDNLFKMVFNGV